MLSPEHFALAVCVVLAAGSLCLGIVDRIRVRSRQRKQHPEYQTPLISVGQYEVDPVALVFAIYLACESGVLNDAQRIALHRFGSHINDMLSPMGHMAVQALVRQHRLRQVDRLKQSRN